MKRVYKYIKATFDLILFGCHFPKMFLALGFRNNLPTQKTLYYLGTPQCYKTVKKLLTLLISIFGEKRAVNLLALFCNLGRYRVDHFNRLVRDLANRGLDQAVVDLIYERSTKLNFRKRIERG